jgi:tetratricopeptide (TPR) repeat protein
MGGRYEDALAFFGRATRLYRRIGDEVSYAYTIWGEGTTHKMLGGYERALARFTEADAIFRKTRDPRGRIYTSLGAGELLVLRGRHRAAERKLRSALESARRLGFRFEEAHARLLLGLLRVEEGRRVSFERILARYARLGTSFPRKPSLPLNIP